MDKYEYKQLSERMIELMQNEEYGEAKEIADSIDWRRVRNAMMLANVSDIYEKTGEYQKSYDILQIAYHRAEGSRKVLYRLSSLALKTGNVDEAIDFYDEFVQLAPKDPNRHILRYQILRAQRAPLEQQIEALEEFKKAEYIEEWAFELAKLYQEAGMTAECLEECDDLILWFSEGKYVYLAMELKMKYKPLTPLQQEKYDSRPGAVKKQPEPVKQTESTLEEVDDENEYDEGSEEEVQESTVQRIDDAQVQEIPPEPVPMQEEFEIPEEAAQADVVPEEVVPEATAAVEETPMYREEEPEASVETPEEHTSAIKQVVTGATLEEALAQGVAVASGINIEEEAMKEREDEILANGQMMIDDILQKWEAKQKDHEEAIAKQKAKDEERLQKEREQARIRQEEERKEVERKAAEAEARRKAEEEARRKAEEEAARKAEEEAADEEKSERNTQRIPDDIVRLMEEMESENEDSEDEIYEEELEDGPGMDEDFIEGIEDELDGLDMNGSSFEEGDFDEGDFEEEDLEGEDFDEADFEEEDLEGEDFDEGDFEEEDFDEEEIEDEDDTEELEIEEPSEEEIQARIKKSKGGVPFDTGFVVTGRYDLSATSEIGLKAGLTEEQKKLFSYFVPVRGMSEQIVEVLDNDRRAQREGTSKTGNLLVIGRKGSGKTVLAVDIVKAIQKQRNLKQGKVAIVTGESLNKKELTNIIQKLRGGAIIIEHAGKLNSRTVKELNYLMEKKTGELLFVLEDQRKPLERLMTANPEFKKKFSSKLELPVFINDELVTFGQTYAKENGYKLDEMGILALYSRIDVMQREDHAVSVAEVKEIMDEAIAHSQKANVKHLARRVFGKGTDDSDRIILKEEDFKI